MSGFLFALFLCLAGGYTAYRLKFFCLLHPAACLRYLLAREDDGRATGYSPMRALCVALAGTLGVGNITGVAAAILLGGPGALFWMWVSSLCTVLIKYAEVYLAVGTRFARKDGGRYTYHGGPMRYLALLPGGRMWAYLFCVLCVFASFLQGNLMQVNAAVCCIQRTTRISPVVLSLLMAVLAAALVFGGRGRIAGFCAAMIPTMTALYLVMGLTVILRNLPLLPTVFSEIFAEAFSLQAFGGGGIGMLMAMRHGCAKGVFTHEAGCGTAPISHAGAETAFPARQGIFGIAEVIVDTPVLCTVTGLALLISGVGYAGGGDCHTAVLDAFGLWFGNAARYFLSVSIVFYAFAALVCWSFYGTECLSHILSGYSDHVRRCGMRVYLTAYCLCTLCGAYVSQDFLWRASDVITMVMTTINTVGVVILLKQVKVPPLRAKESQRNI